MSITCRELIENGEKILRCVEDPLTDQQISSGILMTILLIITIFAVASIMYNIFIR